MTVPVKMFIFVVTFASVVFLELGQVASAPLPNPSPQNYYDPYYYPNDYSDPYYHTAEIRTQPLRHPQEQPRPANDRREDETEVGLRFNTDTMMNEAASAAKTTRNLAHLLDTRGSDFLSGLLGEPIPGESKT